MSKGNLEFDPNAAALDGAGIFGLPFHENNASLVVIPVPWEVTTSYGGGTSEGPNAVLEASYQVDLFDEVLGSIYKPGIFFDQTPLKSTSLVKRWNREGRALAQKIIAKGGRIDGNKMLQKTLNQVNDLGEKMNEWVRSQTLKRLSEEKFIGILGGDHSVPYGAMQAIAEDGHFLSGEYGILHFDAHMDTRNAYEGFQWSHASIMHNVITKIPEVTKLVHVGVRDFCEEEFVFSQENKDRVSIFSDFRIRDLQNRGVPFEKTAQNIVSNLPQRVWVSFDIDGLDPRFCPNTGTPVPGGLELHEALCILKAVVDSGRKIIGFDLNEVAPAASGKSEWDANVGARLLYKLSGWLFKSQKLI